MNALMRAIPASDGTEFLVSDDELLLRLTCAALTGLLADPTPRPRSANETCVEAVARKAVEHARATLAEFHKS